MSRDKERRDQGFIPLGRHVLPVGERGPRFYNICMWESEWPLGVVARCRFPAWPVFFPFFLFLYLSRDTNSSQLF